MKISERILEYWGDVSEQQIALAKDVLIEELEHIGNMPINTTQREISKYIFNRLKELKDE